MVNWSCSMLPNAYLPNCNNFSYIRERFFDIGTVISIFYDWIYLKVETVAKNTTNQSIINHTFCSTCKLIVLLLTTLCDEGDGGFVFWESVHLNRYLKQFMQ